MTELIIEVFMTSAIIAVALNSAPYIWLTEILKLPSEPFRCAMCSGFWLSLFYFLIQGQPFWHAVWCAGTASFVAELMDRKLNA
jgi:hypothetical protein